MAHLKQIVNQAFTCSATKILDPCIDEKRIIVPEQEAMDEALACHAGLNPDMTKDFSAPILLGNPAMCTLTLTMLVVTCSSLNTCHRR